MRINNNMMAMNTHRQLGMANNQGAKSMEKLSSGFRINRAGDDAAGLSISEKMRGQIRGLNQASRNAQDSISLIQTAEGALNESHAILQRMRELAVQSANDTNVDIDRDAIQNEMDQLATELTRIAENTEFNTQNLLDGTFDDSVFHIGANEAQNLQLSIAAMDASALGVAGAADGDFTYQLDVTITEGQDNDATAANFETGTYTIVAADDYEGDALVDDNIESTAAGDVTHMLVDSDGNAVGTSEDGLAFHAIGDVDSGGDTDATRATFTVGAGATEVEITATDAATVTYSGDFEEDQSLADGTYTVVEDGGLQLQDSDGNVVAYSADGVTWTTEEGAGDTILTTQTLAADAEITVGGAAGGIDISTQEAADAAISTINTALERVSEERSMLGAVQNRLEHTISNLDNVAENLQAAESRIRDVDMAAEMMEFTRQNILQQASTAMLAQANVAPQAVLQLLG